MRKMWKYLLFLPLLAFMVSCGDDDDAPVTPEEELPTLVEAAQEAGLTTLLSAVGEVDGLADRLLAANAITVFAPTNAAFTAALEANNASNLEELVEALGGVENLERVLEYHVVASTAFSTDLSDGQTLTTLEGSTLTVNISGGNVTISDVSGNTYPVQTADVEIENGVVHVIGGVLLPELSTPQLPTLVEAATDAGLTTLLAAVNAVDGLGTTLLDAQAITVFAPDNDAFSAALEAYEVDDLDGLVEAIGGVENLELVLGFHVVPAVAFSTDLDEGENVFPTVSGQEITVTRNGAEVVVTDADGTDRNVIAADVAIRNGVVHVIDGVLLPEFPAPNLVDAATEAGLTTLLAAVEAVDGLGQTLLDAEAITVFAPDNDAFAAALAAYEVEDLPGLIEAIGGVENLELVLGFHVVPNVAFSTDLDEGTQTFPTLAGQDITVTRTGTAVTVTDAAGTERNVITADVEIANGVVHVIDGVLLPEFPAPNLVDAATEAGLTTLLAAVEAVDGLGQTLLDAEAITVFAPDNDAFAAALAAYEVEDLPGLIEAIGGVENLELVLGFHVVPNVAFSTDLDEGTQTFSTLAGQDITVTRTGAAVTVTDAAGTERNVITADVEIANGVVHVIDGVLLPEFPAPNLVDAATEAGLTTLLAAVEAVDGLGQTLLDAEAITVFAPDNDAFAAALAAYEVEDLPGLIEAIGGVENLELVLGFHVVPNVAFSTDLDEGTQTFPTLAGQDITVTRTGTAVTVTDAAGTERNVITADVEIANGVVHVIDGVLLPSLD